MGWADYDFRWRAKSPSVVRLSDDDSIDSIRLSVDATYVRYLLTGTAVVVVQSAVVDLVYINIINQQRIPSLVEVHVQLVHE